MIHYLSELTHKNVKELSKNSTCIVSASTDISKIQLLPEIKCLVIGCISSEQLAAIPAHVKRIKIRSIAPEDILSQIPADKVVQIPNFEDSELNLLSSLRVSTVYFTEKTSIAAIEKLKHNGYITKIVIETVNGRTEKVQQMEQAIGQTRWNINEAVAIKCIQDREQLGKYCQELQLSNCEIISFEAPGEPLRVTVQHVAGDFENKLSMQIELEKLEKESLGLKNHIKMLESKLAETQSSASLDADKQQAFTSQIADLTVQLNCKIKELDDTRDYAVALNKALLKALASNDNLKAQVKNLEQRLLSLINENSGYVEKFQASKLELEQAKHLAIAAAKRDAVGKQAVDLLARKNKRLEDAIKEQQAELKKLRSAPPQPVPQVVPVSDELNLFKRKLAALERSNAELEKTVSSVTSERNDLRLQLARTNGKMSRFKVSVLFQAENTSTSSEEQSQQVEPPRKLSQP